MADDGAVCEYVLDPEDHETWGGEEGEHCAVDDRVLNEDGVWTCPHAVETGEELCIFHLPPERKDDRDAVGAFLDAVDDGGTDDGPGASERTSQFLGARFGAFDLRGWVTDLDTGGETVRMTHTEFKGVVNWSGMEVDVASLHLNGCDFAAEISFEGATLSGLVDFSHATFERAAEFELVTFERRADFEGARFRGAVDFSMATFGGDTDFSRAAFDDRAEFGGATDVGPGAIGDLLGFDDLGSDLGVTFEGTVHFDDAEFADDAGFKNASFEEAAYFRASFNKGARFENSTFSGDAHFSGFAELRAEFGGPADFGRVTFDGDTYLRVEFGSDADFHGAEFDGEADFRAEFGGNADFHEAEFGNGAAFVTAVFREEADFSDVAAGTGVDFEGATFGHALSFENADLRGVSFVDSEAQGADFREAHLESADFERASLRNANFERAKLSNTDLFGADLSGARLYGARIGDAAINTETTLDGHGDHRCVYDPRSGYEYDDNDDENVGQLRKAMGAYHVIEELTRTNTLPDEQSQFFVRRQDMRRAQLRREEPFPRLEYWFSEIQNAVFRHGESFIRVIAWAIGVIVAYALVYPAGGWLETTSSTGSSPVTYARILHEPVLLWKSLYHSAMLFTTGNPYGGVTATNVTAEILQTTEALLGPTLLALVVFVLGRRAAR
jgi:uncharacterized protein YjbI with pentapeptide repeats